MKGGVRVRTSYDTLYSTFMNNNLADDIDLPQSEIEIYRVINNAVMLYNNRERDIIVCDDTLEEVDRELNNDEILMIAHYIKLAFLKNQMTAFTLTWQPFDKDMGLRNYDSQVRAMGRLVADAERVIQQFKFNKEVDIF